MIYLRNEEEVALIRKSAQMVAECLDFLEPLTVPGATGLDLDRAAEKFVRERGGEPAFLGYRGFPNTLCISVNEGVVHGIPSDVPFEPGDIVGLDMGVVLNGFYGDSARTLPIGEVEPEVARLMDVTQEAMLKGIEKAVQGNRIGDIGHAVQSYAEGFGFSVVRDLFGHGVGRQLHEDPQIPNYGKPGRGAKLSVGMVIAIEPMITIGSADVYTMPDGWSVVTRDRSMAAHFEHTLAVGIESPEILSVAAQDSDETTAQAAGS